MVEDRRKTLKQLSFAAGSGIVYGSTVLRFIRSDALASERVAAVADLLDSDTLLREFRDIPENPRDYIQPGDPEVEEVADAASLSAGDEGFVLDLRRPMSYPADISPEIQRDWVEPGEYFRSGKGDCEDYALGFASVLESMGYRSRFVEGAVEYGGERDLHAVTESRIGGEWYITEVNRPESVVPREVFRGDVEYWNPIAMFGVDLPYQVYEPEVQR